MFKEEKQDMIDITLEDIIGEEVEPLEDVDPDGEVKYKFPSNKKLLATAEERIVDMEKHWFPIYKEMRDDWEVYNLNQWTGDAILARTGRPLFTQDFTNPFVEYIVASTFEQPSSIKLASKEDEDKLKVKALSQTIKYFESYCNAKESKSWSVECASVGGVGWRKAVYNKADPTNGGKPTIGEEKVANPFSILMDKNSLKLDGSDADYLVEYLDTDKSHYTYYWRDEKDKSIVLWAEIKEGKVVTKKVYPAKNIPIMPVYGKVSHVDGKTVIKGIIRPIKSSQRLWNLTLADQMEKIGTTPSGSTYVERGSLLPDQERALVTSYTRPVSHIYVEANAQGIVNFPKRADTTPQIAHVPSILSQIREAVRDATGIYHTAIGDSAVGAESGVAIEKKNQNGNRGQLRYDSNLKTTDAHMGSLYLDLIQNIIAPSGFLPLENEVGVKTLIPVGTPPNDVFGNPIVPLDEQGRPLPYLENAIVTDADISISTQPAYTTRKSEGVSKVMELYPSMNPSAQERVLPKILEDLDFPNSDTYAKLVRGETEEGSPEQFMQLKASMEAMQAEYNKMKQALGIANDKTNDLIRELETQTQWKLQKAVMDNDTSIHETTIKTQSNEKLKILELEMKNRWHTDDVDIDYAKEINKANIATEEISAEARKQNKDILSNAVKEVDVINQPTELNNSLPYIGNAQ